VLYGEQCIFTEPACLNYLKYTPVTHSKGTVWIMKKKIHFGQPNSPSKPKYVAETFQMQDKTYVTDPDTLDDFCDVK